ncbi:calcyclin-binding protein [Ambystoma mexicanum]|uniref:calcyclin-binding protein n=1 Tax=Ambystoma mexicanum TaxID=8296 RepID=UPI0037E9535D
MEEELRKDLEEVTELLGKASRQRVRKVLLAEQCKLETELERSPEVLTKETFEPKKPAAIVGPIASGYTVKINNYGWDQSNAFVKIYVTLSGVHKVPAENVQVHFGERSFELLVKDLNGKSYSLIINNLLKPISVESSLRKVKTDTILVMCRKKSEQQWECLTQVEKQLKEKNKPSIDKDVDPNEGLMKLMKKMYDEGDDEMKRSLNKAWMETREKQERGQMEF